MMRADTKTNQRGVALLLVLVTMAFMSVLAIEISFASRVDISIGQNARNRLQAQYLAMSAARLQLLRLHMYKEVKNLAAGGTVPIPKDMIDRIWSLPLPVFPLPNATSNWPGTMSALIESEGSKIPINLLDAHNYRRSGTKERDEVVAQIKTLVTSMFEDEEFDKKYRGLEVEELINNLIDWIDPNEEKVDGGNEAGDYDDTDVRYFPRNDRIPSLSELHMIKGWSDDLIKRIAGNFSVLNLATTVNPNYISLQRLKAMHAPLSQEDLNVINRRRQLQPFASMADLATFIQTDPDIKNGRDFALPEGLVENKQETIFIIEASGQVGTKALRKIRQGVRIPEEKPKTAGTPNAQGTEDTAGGGASGSGEPANGAGAEKPLKLLAPVVLTIGEVQ